MRAISKAAPSAAAIGGIGKSRIVAITIPFREIQAAHSGGEPENRYAEQRIN
jgi:hypothetical protein